MVDKTGKSPALRLHEAFVAITASIADPEIARIVEDYGYSRARIEEGRALYDAVAEVNAVLTAAKASRRELSTPLAAARSNAKEAYRLFAQKMKDSFGKAALVSAGLTGPMPRATTDFIKSNFIKRAYTLFDNCAKTPEILAKLPDIGYDSAKVHAERAKIAEYEETDQRYEAAEKYLVSAELDRNAKRALLEKWFSSYLTVATLALRGRADLMEKIDVSPQAEAQQAADTGKKPGTPDTTRKDNPEKRNDNKSKSMNLYDNYNT